MFSVNFSGSNGVFGVPNEVVDEHLRFSGALTLKVLLLLYREGEPMSSSQLASILNQSDGDIIDALNHWIALGLVKNIEAQTQTEVPPKNEGKVTEIDFRAVLNNKEEKKMEVTSESPTGNMVTKAYVPEPKVGAVTESPTVNMVTKAYVPAPKVGAVTESPTVHMVTKTHVEEVEKKVVKERFYRMTRQDVIDVAETDNSVGVLLQEAQGILGRTLSSSENEALVSIYHYYGMGLDIIIMLLEYCKSIDSDRPAYYEKLAVDWINRGIVTHEAANAELIKLTEKDSIEGAVRRLLSPYDRNIYNRKPTDKQVDFYKEWKHNLKLSDELIHEAIERAINNTGKMSLEYANTILLDWNAKNISTLAGVERATMDNQMKKTVEKGSESSSYSLDDLESMSAIGNAWD